MQADAVAFCVVDDSDEAHVVWKGSGGECDFEALDGGPIKDRLEGGVAVEVDEGAFGRGFVGGVGDECAADSAWLEGEDGHVLEAEVLLL